MSLFVECLQSEKNERPNGWYYITDRVEDSISLEPIVTINDFEEIKLHSAENLKGKFIYQITGHVAADCVEKWADATEHSIGKRIGFVLQDEVICTPCIKGTRLKKGGQSRRCKIHRDDSCKRH